MMTVKVYCEIIIGLIIFFAILFSLYALIIWVISKTVNAAIKSSQRKLNLTRLRADSYQEIQEKDIVWGKEVYYNSLQKSLSNFLFLPQKYDLSIIFCGLLSLFSCLLCFLLSNDLGIPMLVIYFPLILIQVVLIIKYYYDIFKKRIIDDRFALPATTYSILLLIYQWVIIFSIGGHVSAIASYTLFALLLVELFLGTKAVSTQKKSYQVIGWLIAIISFLLYFSLCGNQNNVDDMFMFYMAGTASILLIIALYCGTNLVLTQFLRMNGFRNIEGLRSLAKKQIIAKRQNKKAR